jgi:hypothetical protein
MSVDPLAVAQLVAWLLVPWHFALVCALVVVAVVLDVVAVVLISRQVACAVRTRLPALGAVTVTVALRASTPPASWIQRARPVAADYRLTLPAGQPRPIPVAWAAPVRREAPAAVAAPAPPTAAPLPPPPSPVAARVIRPVRPIPVEDEPFGTIATLVIADAIDACRRHAGGETR